LKENRQEGEKQIEGLKETEEEGKKRD